MRCLQGMGSLADLEPDQQRDVWSEGGDCGWAWEDENDARLLGRVRQFFTMVVAWRLPLIYFVAAGAGLRCRSTSEFSKPHPHGH